MEEQELVEAVRYVLESAELKGQKFDPAMTQALANLSSALALYDQAEEEAL